MNDLTSSIGLMRREFRDVHSVVSRLDHQIRKTNGRPTIDRPGGLVVRSALCACLANLQGTDPDQIARTIFGSDRDLDLTLRAAVSPANTTTAQWAAELVATITQDIADRLLPESVFSQLRQQGIQYSLNGNGPIKVPSWSPVASGAFVLEGSPIPVAQYVLGEVSLRGKKAANIVAVDDEMLLGAAGDAETALRTILGESIALMLDNILLGSTAATAAQPPGLLNGITPLTASVLTPASAALVADVKQLVAATAPALKPVMIVSPVQAAAFGLLPAPHATVDVLVSPTLTTGTVIMVDAAAFTSALGVPAFRASASPTLHMDSVPSALSAVGTPNVAVAPMRSAFQTDVTALRSIIPVDWGLRRANAVAVINSTTW